MKIIRVVIFSLSVFFFCNIQLSLYRMEFIIFGKFMKENFTGK